MGKQSDKILISHRGNTVFTNKSRENSVKYIYEALNQGFDVEIDVWYICDSWYLGHDTPEYKVDFSFLNTNGLWLHAKNGDAFYMLLQHENLTSFWHTTETWVLTSKRDIWTFPNSVLYPGSICVLPELGYNGNLNKCKGICSDYIFKYKM